MNSGTIAPYTLYTVIRTFLDVERRVLPSLKIEERNPDEVWPKSPKNVIIHNPAFEKINPKLISGIISEIGIYKPVMFLEELKNTYSWMFL